MDSIENKLSDQSEKELYRRTDEVLHYMWDPIGVSNIPEVRDEYYGYLPQVFMLLKENQDKSKIEAFLNQVETELIGLPADTVRNNMISETLINWKDYIIEKNTNKVQ